MVTDLKEIYIFCKGLLVCVEFKTAKWWLAEIAIWFDGDN
jgi:hypothetical protein